jgi:hypothetical protein
VLRKHQQAQHILLLQDDAVIKDDFFNRLHTMMEMVETRPSEWLDLKLYSQPRLQGPYCKIERCFFTVKKNPKFNGKIPLEILQRDVICEQNDLNERKNV